MPVNLFSIHSGRRSPCYGFLWPFFLSHSSVPSCLRLCRSACRASSDLRASSSLTDGSRISRNTLQGKSVHSPQCSRRLLFRQQSCNGQTLTPNCSVQKGFPSTYPHPLHCLSSSSQEPQYMPQTGAWFLSYVMCNPYTSFGLMEW